MRILIVEDHEPTADRMEALIRKLSGQKSLFIRCVATLAQAIPASERADITFLDLQLQDAGWEKVVASIPQMFPPVIVVTGLSDDDGRIEMECYRQGAQNFFHKPDDIGLIISNLLSSGASAHLRRILYDEPRRTRRSISGHSTESNSP